MFGNGSVQGLRQNGYLGMPLEVYGCACLEGVRGVSDPPPDTTIFDYTLSA